MSLKKDEDASDTKKLEIDSENLKSESDFENTQQNHIKTTIIYNVENNRLNKTNGEIIKSKNVSRKICGFFKSSKKYFFELW